METGQKITQPKNKIDPLSSKALSIQVSLNGLSFCILDRNKELISSYNRRNFKKKISPEDLLQILQDTIDNTEDFKTTFSEVNLIYDNDLSVLVPQPLFDEDNLSDYLKFNSRILKTDFIAFDHIKANDSYCVYIPYMNINNFLIDEFGSFEYRHCSTILIEYLLQSQKNLNEDTMFVHVSHKHFEMVVIKGNTFCLYNSYEIQTESDLLYYILFTAEQLGLNPEIFKLVLFGNINRQDSYYELIYDYVRHVDFLEFDSPYALDIPGQKMIREDFVLLNSF